MIKRKARGLFTVLFLFVVLTFTSSVKAQTPTYQVSVDRLFYNQYPQIDTYVSIVDVQGFPITGFSEENFSVKLDGVETQNFQVMPYTNTEEILAIVLAIDTSGSMDNPKKPTPLDNSVEAAKNFVSKLSPQDLVAVITFADDVVVQSDLTTDKNQIMAILDKLEPKGATAINDAIVDTVDILKNRSERRAIILLTDGKPDGDQVFTFDQALLHASNYKIPIYPIGFGAVDENQLKRLAEVTGGSEQIKADSQALTSAFDNILGVFREQYYLQITSTIEPDNKEHELEVMVDYQGGQEKAFNTFIARNPVMLTVIAPESRATLNGMVTITADVDAMNTITRVDFFVDEELINTVLSSPYQADWDTTKFVTGEHTLHVRAYDDLGFEAEESVDVLVELQRKDWIFWLIGLVVLIGIALFVSLGLRRKKAAPKGAKIARLIEMGGNMPGKEWPLNQQRTKLGRKAANNDIPLKGSGASREHAVIDRTQDGYLIQALKPDNPLKINGRDTVSTTLNNGDVIELGESKFRFEYED